MEPYTKLLKRIIDWDNFGDSHALQLLIYLMSTVNYEPGFWNGIRVKVGQKVTSIVKLADACQCSKNTIVRALKVLVDSGTIVVESDAKKTIITLKNYAKYQCNNKGTISKIDTLTDTLTDTLNGTLTDTLTDHNIRNKEYKEKKNSSKGRFTPPTLEQVVSYCNERKNGVDAQRWFNYYTANGWKVGKNQMKDWQAAVRTWEKGSESKPQRQLESMKTADADSEWK